jgi:nitroreductase
MNLGSCWIQIRNRYHNDKQTSELYVRELLNIPDKYSVAAIIAVGYPAENKAPIKDTDLSFDKVHDETFGTPYIK